MDSFKSSTLSGSGIPQYEQLTSTTINKLQRIIMRTSTLITGAALAASAFASPIFKRDLEIDTVYDVAYETVYVTETEGVTVPVTVSAAAATTSVEQSAPAATTEAVLTSQHYGHRHSWSKAAQSSAAPAVTVVTSEAPAATVVSSATSVAAASSSAVSKAAIPAQGYTSAWTSSWASTWVVTPSAEPTTAVATSSSAAPAATTEVSLLESFHHLLSRDSLHPRVNFESLMAQMFRPASSSQVKRVTSTIKRTSTVKALSTTKKITVTSSKKATSTSKKVSSSVKVSTTQKGTPISTKKASTTSKKTSSSTKKVSSLPLSTVERVAAVSASRNACKRESSVAPLSSSFMPSSSTKSPSFSFLSSIKSPSSSSSSSKPSSSSVKTSSTSSRLSSATFSTATKSSSSLSKSSSTSSLTKVSSSTLISVAKTSIQASTTAAAPAGKATTYQQRVVDHHNVHRANHSAPALTWDTDLANTAAKIAATCVYAHSMDVNGGGYGQNIAAGVEANNVSAVITELFYNGEVGYFNNLYGQANPDMTNFEKWGHFSQLVWKGTTKVGCATQYCSGGLANIGQYVSPHFTVCNYGSPGNYAGEYAQNIGASLNKPTQNWSYNL
ncbi:PR-1-like protein [Aureobasidium pullulans]|nr:PR-1-like protein [Aureobasidium pullulans]